ncbi:RWP-RK domain-containing protein [Acidocella aromatica]|uniref:Uncharacterized protein n=1 Tax=Acidocella aromatica TaxID=1303579 RepID=A0A840VQW1_9PROT|nr:hypothetical protein [Acidocella aromatica]MBB5374499.1 hypothetical protein [Acidocella aromatica]
MTRDELYDLVWSRPVTHVAKDFGVSDVAIRKICKKHGIPLPPLGYWAKLQHGKKVEQLNLPPLQKGQSEQVNLRVHQPSANADVFSQAQEAARQDEAKVGRRITVPATRPDRLHPIAAATEKTLRKAKPDREGFVTSNTEDKVGVLIGQSSIDRAILLINTFLEAAVERGHQLTTSPKFSVIVSGQPLGFRIHETKTKVQHVPTAVELKEQAQRDNMAARYPTLYSADYKIYRTWDYIPSGRIVVEIYDPIQVRWRSDPIFGRWYDRKSSGVEVYLNDMMVALVSGAARAREQRAKEAEEARLAQEAEERRIENEKRARLLARATNFLAEKAEKHEAFLKISRLEQFLGLADETSGHCPFPTLKSAFDLVLLNLRHQISAEALNQEIIDTRMFDKDRWY